MSANSFLIQFRLRLLTCCLLVFCYSGATGQQIEQKARVLENASQAVLKALEFTGFKMSKDYSLTQVAEEIAKLEVAELVSFPSLADQVEGKEVWWIEFDSVLLQRGVGWGSKKGDYYRDFVVTMDATEGHLIEIRSAARDNGDTATRPLTPIDEEQFSSPKRFKGFPESPPGVNFYEVLCSPNTGMIGNSPNADLIVARYIRYLSYYRHEGGQVLQVWTVDFYGTTPFVKGGSDYHSLVNAETGRCWETSTIVHDPRVPETKSHD